MFCRREFPYYVSVVSVKPHFLWVWGNSLFLREMIWFALTTKPLQRQSDDKAQVKPLGWDAYTGSARTVLVLKTQNNFWIRIIKNKIKNPWLLNDAWCTTCAWMMAEFGKVEKVNEQQEDMTSCDSMTQWLYLIKCISHPWISFQVHQTSFT